MAPVTIANKLHTHCWRLPRKSKRTRRRLLPAGAALVLLVAATATQANPVWDHAANITDAANRLVAMHRAQGTPGVIKFLDACYKTHSLASTFSAPLEACMTQDYVHSRVLAEIYTRLPEEARTRFNAPSAERITTSMNARFASIISQYAMSAEDADTLRQSIETHGLPIFLKSALPPRGQPEAGNAAPSGERK